MSEKQILIVTSELVPFHYGGIGTQFKSLSALLNRQGHRVSLLARRPENFDARLYKAHYDETPLFFVEPPPVAIWPPAPFAYAATVERRFNEINAVARPDLVICADFNAEGLLLFLRSAAGAYGGTQFLLTINGMNAEVISVRESGERGESASIRENPDIRLLLAMEDLCVHLAPVIVAPSASAWEEVRSRLGIHKAAQIIPNLADPLLFSPDRSDSPQASREPLILFIGRLDRMKGTDLLLKAYFEVASRMEPVVPRIVFIGRDCYWNEYGSTFLEYWKNRIPGRYAGHISFLGQVAHDAIRDYLQRASVAVFPSRWEPFGIVCLEALSMGCPVVVSRGTGLEEVLGSELSDLAVPVTEDIRPLAEKILSLLGAGKRGSVAEPPPTGDVQSERLRSRAREVVQQAETRWRELLREIDQKDPRGNSGVNSLNGSFYQLLTSLDDATWRGETHLQVYFCRKGVYAEADSLREPYSRLGWTTLTLKFPRGTGEGPLRLDPSDASGTIRIREIVLRGEEGDKIWRADGANCFRGCRLPEDETLCIEEACLVIRAVTDDPQLFLDCPTTERPVELRIVLYASDG